ncbi:MAG: DUF4402 domain-containing protein [Alphaproteobacteria bacterium]|nr:MAG: DUF4402 domain-containing protein [Alphaproteobacteria bacterium]
MPKARISHAFVLTTCVAALLGGASAWAATQSVTANMRFDAPLTLTKTSDIDLGSVTAATASTYTISTAGSVTTTAGPGVPLAGPTAAGSITISGSSTQLVDISAGGYTASNGVTPSNATCAYDGGAEGSCGITGAAAPGAGKNLLVGVRVNANGTQASGTSAAPSFNITVVYQ